MKKNRILLLTVAFLLNQFCVTAQSKITAIEAKLFYNENREQANLDTSVCGQFSQNIINNEDFILWNAVIGEGSSEAYTSQTIVIVSVASKSMSGKNQILKFTATAGKETLLQQQKTFSSTGNNSTCKILFLLDNTGCEKITIKTELLNQGKTVSTMSRNINFHCGE